ncbi:hypothetical protein EIQ19_19235 [Xanthomonas campestris pv. campestris]|nr:hypothetical protein [Xanthomonas hortorum pv. vitians]
MLAINNAASMRRKRTMSTHRRRGAGCRALALATLVIAALVGKRRAGRGAVLLLQAERAGARIRADWR